MFDRDLIRYIILFFIGLGAISGVALFLKALGGNYADSSGKSTLWGLFIIGIVATIFLLLLTN